MKRRDLLLAAAALGLPTLARAAPPLAVVRARPVQGGHAVIRTAPGAELLVDGQPVGAASPAGLAIVGFDRDSAPRVLVGARSGGAEASLPIAVGPGDFDVQKVSGLPPSTVNPTDPLLLERIKREAALKAEAFASRWNGDGFSTGFAMPVQARVSGRFGGQRVLNGVPARPHYGVDLACARGTPVLAPARGLVVLAEPSLHYEGGLILVDHGQGLVSAYLHLSALNVVKGAVVAPGQRLGAVGSTGRATGPHLCWRLKWRERNMDPTLLT